jgi:DNA polymerase III gamma/tau subunit
MTNGKVPATQKTTPPAKENKGRDTTPVKHRAKGGTYKVSGNAEEAPTSAQVQLWANEQAISSEKREVFKDGKTAMATMRAINMNTGQFVDDTVILLYDHVQEKMMVELVDRTIEKAPRGAKKTPLIADLTEPLLVNEEGHVVANLTPRGIIKMKKQLVNYWHTAERTAQTMASRRAQDKILNKEWRTKQEIKDEEEERSSVDQMIKDQKEPEVKEKPKQEDKKDEKKPKEKAEKKKETKKKRATTQKTKGKTADEKAGAKGVRTFTKKQKDEMKKSKEKRESTEDKQSDQEDTKTKTESSKENADTETIDNDDDKELNELNPMALVDRLITRIKDKGEEPNKKVLHSILTDLRKQKIINPAKFRICRDYLMDLDLG